MTMKLSTQLNYAGGFKEAVLDAVVEEHPVADPRHPAHQQDPAVGAGRNARQVGPRPDLLVPLEVDRGQDGGHGRHLGPWAPTEIISQGK